MSADAPGLVPELLVTDLDRSLAFWCGICGFDIAYDRPEERFAYLVREGAHVILEQAGVGRNWIAAPMERPLGRGMNLQIGVTDLEPILTALDCTGIMPFMAAETRWYRIGPAEEAGVRQVVVADPDGYLLRFQASLARRATQNGSPFGAGSRPDSVAS